MAIKIPNRTGEGFAGIDRFSSNEANLADCLNQITDNLASIAAASQLIDFAAFKAALGSVEMIEKSDDSRV